MEHLANNDETNDSLANRLNEGGYCRTLDQEALNKSIQEQLTDKAQHRCCQSSKRIAESK